MTQIEQIRQAIERLKSQLVRGACAAGIAMETNCKEEAYNEVLAFIDSLPAESNHPRLRNKESWISEAKREKSFTEYLQGVFEINNGVENDPATLAALHGPTLFELGQKELAESPDFEAEWKRYTASRKDDMRSNAATMNVKEVAKHFAEWQKRQFEKNRLAACDAQTKEEHERETAFVDKIVIGEHRMPTFSDAINYGINWQKQQMMEEAVVECKVQVNRMNERYLVLNNPIITDSTLKEGDKVKLIILKEDE